MKLTVKVEKAITEGSVIRTNKNYLLVIKVKDNFKLLNIETNQLLPDNFKDLEAISEIFFIREIYDPERIEMIIK